MFAVQESPLQPLQEPLEAPVSPVEAPVTPKPTMTKQQHLYDVAYACRGRDMSPLDKAPDSLGCMESLDGVFLEAFGEHLLPPEFRLSTQLGYKAMLTDPRLELINNQNAGPGDIGIAPTGTSTKGSPHGHCCVRGKETMMSIDSSTGEWTANYTLAAWDLVFGKTLGFKTYWFRVKD